MLLFRLFRRVFLITIMAELHTHAVFGAGKIQPMILRRSMNGVKIRVDKFTTFSNVHCRNAVINAWVMVMLNNSVLLVTEAQQMAQFANLSRGGLFTIGSVTIDYERRFNLTHPRSGCRRHIHLVDASNIADKVAESSCLHLLLHMIGNVGQPRLVANWSLHWWRAIFAGLIRGCKTPTGRVLGAACAGLG